VLNIQLFRRLLVAVVLSLLVAMAACQGVTSAQPNKSGTGSSGSSQLSVSPATISFGNVAAGSTQSRTGNLSASGASVTISSAAWNGQGYSVSGITFPVSVAAGSSVSYTVSFTPQGAGSAPGSISFVSDAANSPSTETLTGTGTQALQPAFYVAANGNDNNPGTLSLPFATLAKAQQAMQGSSSYKTTYIRAGIYKPAAVTGASCMNGNASGASVDLSSADNGETWSFYPPDGYNSAIFDGQSTVGNSGGTGGNGTGCAISAYNVSNITIVGLQFENYLYSAFWVNTGSNLAFTSNVVHNLTAAAWAAGAVSTACAPGTVVKNNYMYNLAYTGTELLTRSACPEGISNIVVSGNVIENSCTWPAVAGFGNDQNGGDCGAIYLDDVTTPSSTNVQVMNNYVRDVNISSGGAGDNGANGQGGCCAVGVYLDDGTSNVTVSGNIIAGIMSGCFQINDAANDLIEGNICDLADSGYQDIVIYTGGKHVYPMSGNVFKNNIVISASTGSGSGFEGSSSPPSPMTISNNAYYNYVGSSINSTGTGGAGSDVDPVYENPQLSGWTYSIAGASPVFNSPVVFPGIMGGWGPPGFAIPRNGTPPSCPH
jgi:Right handed beta helix region/Abnormal spindle-like microcephaly-assoc'd, ASPM-SPD-2-Hydin